MTIKWFQLVGGSYWGQDGRAFSGAAEGRAFKALQQIEADVLAAYDGARWLAQQGYERVALGLEYRVSKRGRALRSVAAVGRLLSPEYSVVWPELEQATVEEIRAYLEPVVLEALAFVGERKNLGDLPRAGQTNQLESVPLKPLVDDPPPYDEEPGDTFVITRDFPPDTTPEQVPDLLRQYDKDLENLLSKNALNNILDIESSPTAVRWVIRVN